MHQHEAGGEGHDEPDEHGGEDRADEARRISPRRRR